MTPGWQKLREAAKGLRQKVWTGTKNFSPNISHFVAILSFVAIYALFGRHLVEFWVRVFLGQEVQHCMVYIPYYTE